ncbi:MAG TPA: hypothetical protein VMR59_03605 [Patescibacteria group bacterium]|jgi:hypothetical protein|nr:hypothetical protein [Patescibacteria group bacterium]
MTAETSKARINARPLSPDAIEHVKVEQTRRLDEARKVFESTYDWPYQPQDSEELYPEVHSMLERLNDVINLTGVGIVEGVDSASIEWDTSRIWLGPKSLLIRGEKPHQQSGAMLIELRDKTDNEQDYPTAVTVSDALFTYSGECMVNTTAAMVVAKAYFDALIMPWEEAYGIAPKTGNIPEQRAEEPKAYTIAEKARVFALMRGAEPKTDEEREFVAEHNRSLKATIKKLEFDGLGSTKGAPMDDHPATW